ncbi:MAG: Bifunctional protein HldE [Chlamydiae bacterium]|nr:Bifunctional protein HldE [Chlamydiota bacterium]
MVKIPLHLFSDIQPKKILVIGDFILDTYTHGNIERISPEAPVPILHTQREESRLGGACNVALNLKTLSTDVEVIGAVGKDRQGQMLKSLLEQQGLNVDKLLERNVPTTTKNRLIVQGQQILRIDHEEAKFLTISEENAVIELFKESLDDVDVVVFSDYFKGFLTKRLLKEALQICKERQVISIVDPKGHDFSRYRGASLIKPNEKEAYMAARAQREEPIENVAKTLFEVACMDSLFITRASKGISVFHRNEHQHFASEIYEVKDVTGAGDTVCAMLSFCMAQNWGLDVAAELSNIAAGMSLEHVGCKSISLSELSKRLLKLHFTSKVFENENLYALNQILSKHPFSLLKIDSSMQFSANLFEKILHLENPDLELVVFLEKYDLELINILNSIHAIDYIVLSSVCLKQLLDTLHPKNIYLFKENQLTILDRKQKLFAS